MASPGGPWSLLARHRGTAFFAAGFALTTAFGWVGLPAALYEEEQQPLSFDHRAHGEAAGLGCDDCHALGAATRLPGLDKCAECHASPTTGGPTERALIDGYLSAKRPIPWRVYARQPDNVFFTHAAHVRLAEIACARCHGAHGTSSDLPPFARNRLSGYSRDLWGRSLLRLGDEPRLGMKMSDCVACHRERRVRDSCLDCHR